MSYSHAKGSPESTNEKGQAEALALLISGILSKPISKRAWSIPQNMNLARDLDGYASVVKPLSLRR